MNEQGIAGRVARAVAAEDVHDVAKRYPVKNRAWDFDKRAGKFVVEASTLGSRWTDPWNRRMPTMKPHKDRENEITEWTGTTTVYGIPVPLLVFND